MAGIGDLIKNSWEGLKARSSDTYDAVTGRGARATTVQPASPTTPAPAPSPAAGPAPYDPSAGRPSMRMSAPRPAGTSVVPYNPVVGQAFAPPGSPEFRGMQNPNVGPGRPSPEAQAFRASRAVERLAPPPAAGARGLLSRAGRFAGPAALALTEGPDLVKAGLANAKNPNATMADVIRPLGRASLRGGMTLLGGAGGALLGTALGPVGTVGGGTAGGMAGYALGDKMADFVFGPDGQPVPAAAPQPAPATMPPTIRSADALPAAPAEDNLIPVSQFTGGGRATPEAMIANSGIIPERGYGAFKRTTPGNEGPATRIADAPVQAPAAPRGSSTREAVRNAFSGIGNAVAAGTRLAGERYREAADLRREELGVKKAQAGIAVRKYLDDRRAKNEADVNKSIDDMAEAATPADAGGSTLLGLGSADTAKRADAVKQRAAAMKGDYRFTVNSRGLEVGDLTAVDKRDMVLAGVMRQNNLAGRTTWGQAARDFFGQKRADSRDLLSYTVAGVEPTLIPGGGGYKVRLRNGNTATIQQQQGGALRFFGPNEPIDADIAALIKPHVDAYEAKQKGTP